MKRRLIGFLMCAVLVLSLLPAAVSADGGTKIDTVDIIGFVPPVPGAVPCGFSDLSVPAGAHYSIEDNGVRWAKYIDENMVDSQYLEENEVFEEEKAYYIIIDIAAEEGYSFSSNVILKLDGLEDIADNIYSDIRDGHIRMYSVDCVAFDGHIDEIRIDGLPKFTVGMKVSDIVAELTVPTDAHYSLYFPNNCSAADVSTNVYIRDDSVIEKGKSYRMVLRVVPDSGWKIDGSTKWYINGGDVTVQRVGSDSKDGVDYWYIWTGEAQAEEVQPKEVQLVKDVYISGYQRPVIGKTAGESRLYLSVSSGKYEIKEYYWFCDSDSMSMKDGDTFAAGKQYSVCTIVKPLSGFAFDNSTKFHLNDGAFETLNRGKKVDGVSYYVWTDVMTAEEKLFIKEADVVGFVPPVPGAEPCWLSDISAPEGAHYSVSEVTWFVFDPEIGYESQYELTKGDMFKEGMAYYFSACLTPEDGCSFYSGTSWLINGMTEYVEPKYCEVDYDGIAQLMSCDFFPNSKNVIIKDVYISGYQRPVVGKTAGESGLNLTVPAGEYEIKECYWFCDSDSMDMKDGDTFAAGKQYSVCTIVKPLSGFTFDDSTKFHLNDGAFETLNRGKTVDGVSYYVWTKTMTAEEPEAGHIGEIRIDGLPEFTAGMKASDIIAKLTVPAGAHYSLLFIEGFNIAEGYFYINDDTALAEGGNYKIVFCVIPENGWVIDENTKWVVNGGSVDTTDGAAESYEGVEYWYVWSDVLVAAAAEKTCPSGKFTDAPAKGNWAHEGIDYCVANGLMSGMSDTVFEPGGTVTRAQLVTILYRVAGKPAASTKNTFTDVPEGKWYTDAIEWAAENGIVSGTEPGKFNPMGNITREQIAAILYRYEGSPAVSGDLTAFPDSEKVHSYAQNAMIWATQNGLISGIKSGDVTTLAPQNNATRAQIASIIMRFLGGAYSCE